VNINLLPPNTHTQHDTARKERKPNQNSSELRQNLLLLQQQQQQQLAGRRIPKSNNKRKQTNERTLGMTAGPGLVSPTSDVCKALVVPFFIVPPPRRVPRSSVSNQKPTLPERCKTRNHNRLSFFFKKERARIKKRKNKKKQPLSYLMRVRER
jgi:hypothetical protein